MARNLSVEARRALFAQETKTVFLLLLTITHPSFTPPIRVVNNTKSIVSNGETYAAFPFEIVLPDERDDSLPQMTLRIDNVDRAIVKALRSIATPASLQLDVVLSQTPDLIEASFMGFTLSNANYDSVAVEGVLSLEDVLNQPYPGDAFTPSLTPRLF